MYYEQDSRQIAFSANRTNGIMPTLHRHLITVEDAIESEQAEAMHDDQIENEVNDILYEDQLADYKESIN